MPESVRSLLFVPGDRPDRFARACASGADLVCLDLEDATPPASKANARAACLDFLQSSGARAGVRINGLDTEWSRADFEAIAGSAAFLMIPKAEDRNALERLRGEAPHMPLWPLIETAEGLRNAWEITAAAGVVGILFGAFDYSVDVGCELDWEPLLFARSLVAAACARVSVQAMDAPYGDISDNDGLKLSTLRARALGFTARACIHPAQVTTVNSAFTPTEAQVARARAIVEAFDAARGAAAQLDGRLIELPVVLAARRTLEQSQRDEP